MSMFFTLWVTCVTTLFAGSVVAMNAKEWDYGNTVKCVSAGIVTFLFTIPAIYEFGWVALPMALGR